MKIKIEAVNVESGARRELGTCLTNSPTRAIQAYENRLNEYERLEWEDITNKAAATLGRKGGKARAGRPAAVAASRENGKKGGAPRQPRYTLTTTTNTWDDLTMRELVRIVLKKWPDHEWPEDDKEFLDELNSLDPQGIRVEIQ